MSTELLPYTSSQLSSALALVESGKLTLAQAVLQLSAPVEVPQSAPVAYKVPQISDTQRAALTLLPSVYGSVVPNERRELTQQEVTALLTERNTLDQVLAFAKKRKEDSIRETLANHFDVAAERKGVTDALRDDKGHYILDDTREVEAGGTGEKFTFSASNPSPEISSADLEAAHLAGDISREDYLSITSEPTVKRVFNEDKARKAIKANPDLLGKIAAATKPGKRINTLRVAKAG